MRTTWIGSRFRAFGVIAPAQGTRADKRIAAGTGAGA
jgi:hypothetical protein